MDEQGNLEYLYLKSKDIYSTQSILASFETPLEDTIYAASANDFLRWPFNAADFFELETSKSLENEFNAEVPDTAKKELEEINLEIKSYKFAGTTIENQERIKKLRTKKKALMAQLESSDSDGKKSIVYKTFVEINDHKIPGIKHPDWQRMRSQSPGNDHSPAVNIKSPRIILGEEPESG